MSETTVAVMVLWALVQFVVGPAFFMTPATRYRDVVAGLFLLQIAAVILCALFVLFFWALALVMGYSK